MNLPDTRDLARAKPAGTPTNIASVVEAPAVMKLFINALGKSERVMLKKLSIVIANGLSQIGSNIADCSRNDRIRTQSVGSAANASRTSMTEVPIALFARKAGVLSIMKRLAG